jgi:hypothetical protein
MRINEKYLIFWKDRRDAKEKLFLMCRKDFVFPWIIVLVLKKFTLLMNCWAWDSRMSEDDYLIEVEPGGPVRVKKFGSMEFEPVWKEKCSRAVGYIEKFNRRSLEILSFGLVTLKQELRFRKDRLINHKYVNYVRHFLEQLSLYFSYSISSLSRVSPKSIKFYDIDQRQEQVGSEATSSSEDG